MTFSNWTPEVLLARFNAYPPFEGAGARITYIAEDASEIRVEMPLTDRNKNLVGTHFGGSLYSMVDPHLMILLVRRLGPDYVVWDKEATIDFKKPGTSTVRAGIRITDQELESIRQAAAGGEKHLPEWTLEILDEDDELVATVHKTLYVRLKRPG